MIYGHKKAMQMARDGLVCGSRDYTRPSRSVARRALRRFLDGDEDVDVTHDEYAQAHRSDWDGYAYCNAAFQRWAVGSTADVTDPESRFGKLRKFVRSPVVQYHLHRALQFSDSFATDRSYLDRYPTRTAADKVFYAEVAQARRVRLLQEIVQSGWGHRMLNRVISHSTVIWTVWTKDAPTEVPDGVSRRMKVVLRDRFVYVRKGPESARKLLGIGDIPAFLRDITAAAQNAVVKVDPYIVRMVKPTRYYYRHTNLTRHTYVEEHYRSTRTNPDYHPEWSQSVDVFLDVWEASAGDPEKLQEKYLIK